ncbi:TetR/AcrR family transcriptional regulator [Streptomyces sp. NPDC051567]|uniref:TetR/AcrR family transcriptional regulator n=1 Tax=Streptomyces sp. NPDC051567 TaxID=3365660 RepID=UPI0037A3AD0F
MTTAKGAARRAALLDAAERTLVGGGHAALSLRAVAEAAGVRLGHLQYYFPSRERLVEELLARLLQRSLDRLTDVIPGPDDPDRAGGGTDGGADDPPARLNRLVGVLLAEQTDPELVRVFVELWALAARDEAVAVAVRAFYRRYAELVTDQIRAHLPGATAEEHRARAEVFIALVEGSSLIRSGVAGTPSPTTDALISRTALSLLCGAEPA